LDRMKGRDAKKTKKLRARAENPAAPSDKGDSVTESQHDATDAATGSTLTAAAPSTSAAASLKRTRTLATTAFVVALIGVVAAVTGPVWSPKLYGDPDSPRFVALGLAQLRPALERDGPFGVQLSTLRRVMPNDPALVQALGTIAVFADKGAPTVAQLRGLFVEMASEIMLGDVVGPNKTWLDRAVVKVASTLELHAVAHRLNDPREPSALVWDAQAHLDAGDLPGTVATLDGLTGRAAVVAAPWIAAARERLAANKVLMQLDSLAEQLAAGSSPVKSVAN
jgi:hypothetical protein